MRAEGSWAYGWYRVVRVWEISQAYEVFRGDLYVPCERARKRVRERLWAERGSVDR